MKKQALVVGLGQFGMSVARALVERGVEVLAVDHREDRVRVAAAFATQAAEVDATSAEALGGLSPQRRDVCVCAIGDEGKQAAIICTALLKQLGAKRVVARANDEINHRILTLIGADHVVNPEREFGERFANQIIHADIRGEMALGGGLMVTEAQAPQLFVGRTLRELSLPHRFKVTVVALRRADTDRVRLPRAEERIEPGDVLVLVAEDGAVTRMLERV